MLPTSTTVLGDVAATGGKKMFPFQKKKTDTKDMAEDKKETTKKKNPFAEKGFGKKPMFPPKPMSSPRSF